jgi:dolichol-phosphate mannosyltransferase
MPDDVLSFSLIVAVKDEKENMAPLIGEIADALKFTDPSTAEVIFVDDGSSDGTAEVIREHARDLHYAIVTHTVNRGLGTAINTGIRAALGESSDDDAIVTLEADTTSNLGDLPKMMERFDAGADVVLASVYAPGGSIVGVAGWRLAASKSVSNTFRYLGGLREIHTLSSLYRVYRAGTLRRAADTYGYLLVREPGFAANVELLLKLYNAGAVVTEVPTTNDWTTRKGESKMQLKPTVVAYMRLMAAHLVGRIQPPPVSPLAEATAPLPMPSSGPGETVEHPPAIVQTG